MIVVVGTKGHKVDSICSHTISRLRERVILGEDGGRGIDTNSLICENFHAFERICIIESEC